MKLKLSNLRQESCTNLKTAVTHTESLSYEQSSGSLINVLPGLFLSDYKTACNEVLLKRNNIEIVINLTGTLENKFPLQYEYYNFTLHDDPSSSLEESIEYVIEEVKKHLGEGKNVLVHCRKAISRAPSVVMGYLIKVKGFSFDTAFELLREKKRDIDPNVGLIVQLQNF